MPGSIQLFRACWFFITLTTSYRTILITKRNYLVLNIIFGGIILAIFLYSAIYSPDGKQHPVKCIHEELLGAKCPTCGMSRGFSAIVRGRIEEARILQPNTIAVFSFFAIQLAMRMALLYFILKTSYSIKILANVDMTLSMLLFIFTFRNLILQTFYIFYKMLLTGNVV